MIKQIRFALGVALVAVVIAIGGYWYPLMPKAATSTPVSSPEEQYGSTGTRFPNGLSANTTSPVPGQLLGTTLTVTGASTFGGLTTIDAGLLHSFSKASTTSATTYTLTQADILNFITIRQTLTGGAATFTFPATNTITTFVPAAGDMQEQCWLPLTNNLTFAAGAGIDLETATSSSVSGAYDLTISAGNVGCLRYIRKTNTDIHVGLLEYSDAD